MKNPCSQRYAREDAITSQIKEEIKKVSLSSAWANASIAQFEKEKMKIAQAESSFAQKARNELLEIETKLDRLLDLQLDGNLSQTEYTAKKYKLILAKKDLEEKISAFGRKSNNRFELPHCRPHLGFGFQKCLQNSGKIPCRGALRQGNFLRFHKK